MESLSPLFERAEELKRLPSSEEKLPSDGESDHWFLVYQKAKLRIDACEAAIAKYKSLRIKEKESGKAVDEYIGVQARSGRRFFDEKSLKEANPDIYAKFVTVETSKDARGSFRIAKVKDLDFALIDIDMLLDNLIKDFLIEIEKPETVRSESELHNFFLNVNSALAFAEWEQEVATVQLKVLCGTAEGISGICTWKRSHTTSETFDLQALKSQYPELVDQFTRESESTTAYTLETKSAYKE